jgi:hypothetical protein
LHPSENILACTLFGTKIWIQNKSHGFGDANSTIQRTSSKNWDDFVLPNTNSQSSWYKQEQWNKKRSKVINLEILDDDLTISARIIKYQKIMFLNPRTSLKCLVNNNPRKSKGCCALSSKVIDLEILDDEDEFSNDHQVSENYIFEFGFSDNDIEEPSPRITLKCLPNNNSRKAKGCSLLSSSTKTKASIPKRGSLGFWDSTNAENDSEAFIQNDETSNFSDDGNDDGRG